MLQKGNLIGQLTLNKPVAQIKIEVKPETSDDNNAAEIQPSSVSDDSIQTGPENESNVAAENRLKSSVVDENQKYNQGGVLLPRKTRSIVELVQLDKPANLKLETILKAPVPKMTSEGKHKYIAGGIVLPQNRTTVVELADLATNDVTLESILRAPVNLEDIDLGHGAIDAPNDSAQLESPLEMVN